MKSFNVHTSVTFDVSMTELRALLDPIIPPMYKDGSSNITLSCQDSLTGLIHSIHLDILTVTIHLNSKIDSLDFPKSGKSGAEPT